MKTKLTAVLLCVFMVFSFGCVCVSADAYGDLYYSVSAGEATITGALNTATDINIPAEINGYPVTSINDYAFEDETGITSVTFPDSITEIGYSAFEGCTKLTSVTIPDGVTLIDDYAFEDCTALALVTLPDTLSTIGIGAFKNTAYYNDTNNWENGVLYIGNNLIDAESSITSLSIKSGTKCIADYALDYCTSITSVTIPDGVTSIGEFAFSDCTSLTSVTIPEGVTIINQNTFEDCTNLISVSLPDALTSIDYGAFRHCYQLRLISIPDSVTAIGPNAFDLCYALTSINIPKGITEIYQNTFSGCKALTSVTIPDTVTKIGFSAFSICSSLTSLTIPDSVDEIDYGAFSGCTSLASITLPDKVIKFGSNSVFHNTAYYNDASNRVDGVLYIGNHAIEASDYTIAPTSSTASCTIKPGTKYIADHAFKYCHKLVSVTLPQGLEYIGKDAFFGCSGLTSISVPDGVTYIGYSAFYNCTELASVTFPDSLTYIGSYVLDNTAYYNGKNWENGGLYVGKHLINVSSSAKTFAIREGTKTVACHAATYSNQLVYLVIPASITHIHKSAFDVHGIISVSYAASEADWKNVHVDAGNNFSKATFYFGGVAPLTATKAIKRSSYRYDFYIVPLQPMKQENIFIALYNENDRLVGFKKPNYINNGQKYEAYIILNSTPHYAKVFVWSGTGPMQPVAIPEYIEEWS